MNTESIKWAEHRVEARGGGAWRVPAGGLLRVTDIEGSQTGDVFLVDAADVSDGLSNGRSFDYNDSIFLSIGSRLYSSLLDSLDSCPLPKVHIPIMNDGCATVGHRPSQTHTKRATGVCPVQSADVRDPVRRHRATSELLRQPDGCVGPVRSAGVDSDGGLQHLHGGIRRRRRSPDDQPNTLEAGRLDRLPRRARTVRGGVVVLRRSVQRRRVATVAVVDRASTGDRRRSLSLGFTHGL
jgi:hypothetical protein